MDDRISCALAAAMAAHNTRHFLAAIPLFENVVSLIDHHGAADKMVIIRALMGLATCLEKSNQANEALIAVTPLRRLLLVKTREDAFFPGWAEQPRQ